MLDSILTLKKGAVFWMLGAIALCIVLDRAVSLLTGLAITMFLVFAAGIAACLLVAGTYTLTKPLWQRRDSA